MSLPLPELDDRRFDDLVAALHARLATQLPDLTPVAPGDPLHAVVDLFAWITETVLYRANRIPERQRIAFLNLLQVPLQPARPARGLVCVDALDTEAPLLRHGSGLRGKGQPFVTHGELQPAPVQLKVLVKRTLSAHQLTREGITLQQLRDQYGVEPKAFRPTSLMPGKDALSTTGSVDLAFHLALALPRPLVPKAALVRERLAGSLLNMGLTPPVAVDEAVAERLPVRRLVWELAWWADAKAHPEDVSWLPLEVVDDTSRGGRIRGVVRLRLPSRADFLKAPEGLDPQYAGMGDTPPEPPADLKKGELLCWLRLRAEEGPLDLGWIGVNAVVVRGQGLAQDVVIGAGTGRPDQTYALPHTDVEEASLRLEVQHLQVYEPWTRVDAFAGFGPSDRVFMVQGAEGRVRFGDGLQGARPGAGMRIRAASYRHGGGTKGNLPPGSIKELLVGSGHERVRQDLPTTGGMDRESVAEAERRIPAFLNHRDRAVTVDDFSAVARETPGRLVARADAVAGFLPGTGLSTIQRKRPGVVSVFVLPPAEPGLGNLPRATPDLLRAVHAHLSSHTLLGTELYVLSPQYVPVSLAISLDVTELERVQEILRAVEVALVSHLWPLAPGGSKGQGWPRKRSVELNELRTVAAKVEGVEAVNGARLFTQDLRTGRWREVLGGQPELALEDYQLPALMAIRLQLGEVTTPQPPEGFGPVTPGKKPSGSRPIPVPVLPELC